MPRTPPLEEEQQKPKEKERPDMTDPRQRLLAYVLFEREARECQMYHSRRSQENN